MNAFRNGSRILCGAIVAVVLFLAGCSGHGVSIVPPAGNNAGTTRLHPLDANGSFEQLVLQSTPTQYFELEETGCCAATNIGSSGTGGTYTASGVTYSLAGPLVGETSTAIGLPGNTGTTAVSMGVSFPNPSTSAAFTVEDWVFPVFTPTHVSVDAYYTIWGSNGSHRLLISNQSTAQGQLLAQFGGVNLFSTKKLKANAWNQVVYVYDGANESLYINGAFDKTLAVSGVAITTAYWAGQYDASANYKLNGNIAQHMMFPSALSAATIQSHYAAATSGGPPPTPTATPTATATPTSGPTGSPQLTQKASGASYAPSTITVRLPTAPAAGNLLLAFFHNNGNTSNVAITYAPPTGWTQIDVDTAHSANGYQAFYHVVGSSETNGYVFTPNCACREQTWTAVAFSGVNTSSPIDQHGFAYVPKSTPTFMTPTETPSQAGDLAVAVMMPTTLGSQTWSNPNGWTVDIGPTSTWPTEIIQQPLSNTSAVSVTSTLSAASYGYAALVLLAPGSGGGGGGGGGGGSGSKVDWPTWGMKPSRNSYNPTETTLTKSNVGGLHQIWSATVGGVLTDEPVVAANVAGTSEGTADLLFVGDAHANFYALDANTGNVVWMKTLQTQSLGSTSSCQDQPGSVYGIGGSATVDRSRNLVFTVDAMGLLYGFDLATGTQKIGPVQMWAYNSNGVNISNDYGGLTEDVNAGVVYVPSGAHCGMQNFGGVHSYTISSGAVAHWYTEGGPPNMYGGIWGPGGAVMDPRGTNAMYVGTSYGPLGTNEYPYSIVSLTRSLSLIGANNAISTTFGQDYDYGATPLVFSPSGCGQTLVGDQSKNGVFYLYNADNITPGPIQTIQMGTPTGGGVNVGGAAYDPTTNMMYINNGSDSTDTTISPAILHGLLAFNMSGCQIQTSVAWQQTVGPSNNDDGPPGPPTVANGVVYYVDGPGSGCTSVGDPTCMTTADFYAFDGTTGSVLYHTTLPGPLFTPPVVVNGKVYLTTWNGGGPGIVYCFGL